LWLNFRNLPFYFYIFVHTIKLKCLALTNSLAFFTI